MTKKFGKPVSANGPVAQNPHRKPLDLSFLNSKSVLVTGGTGSFGKRFVHTLLDKSKVSRLTVFSRDELKQSEMAASIKDARLRFFLGDIRDAKRLQRALYGVDYVVHAAALKQVPTLEYNPFEAVLTNIIGAQYIIDACIDQGVKRVVALSTDKACNPINLYGATKLCMEKLFVAGNSYVGSRPTRFGVVRYGNVIGSRGSVVPLFKEKMKDGVLPITDERMTRFWISLDQGVAIVLDALRTMRGGEIFVPKIPSMKITDLAKAMAPSAKVTTVGIRPGEKLHEVLLTEEESARASDCGTHLVVRPSFPWWDSSTTPAGRPLPNGFRYSSDSNDDWLDSDGLKRLLTDSEAAANRMP